MPRFCAVFRGSLLGVLVSICTQPYAPNSFASIEINTRQRAGFHATGKIRFIVGHVGSCATVMFKVPEFPDLLGDELKAWLLAHPKTSGMLREH